MLNHKTETSFVRVAIEGRKPVRCRANTPAGDLLAQGAEGGLPYIAALVNNDLVSLSYPLDVNCSVRFLNAEHSLGMRVYRNSLSFLLSATAAELFPNARFSIEHSLGTGFYYTMEAGRKLSQKQVERMESRMRAMVESDIPITRRKISFTEADRFFRRTNHNDRADLLKFRNPPKVVIYSCGPFVDLAHGPLAPRTGILKTFKLIPYPPGLVLQFPRPDFPLKIAPFRDQPHLFQIFHEHKQWGRILGVHNVGKLNSLIVNGGIEEFIRVDEAFHEKKIAIIADSISSRKKQAKVILISGPSAAGKTTFAKRLAVQLQANGLRPVTISLDNYYVNDRDTPLDDDGRPDYEHVKALDIELFNRNIISLIAGREIDVPFFNFNTKRREYRSEKMRLATDQAIIVEGIHALNPLFTHRIAARNKFKIYVSALTQLNVDSGNRISTTDNRLMRRLVRDGIFRSNSPLTTLRMWPSVRRGEKKWIFPFQQNADATFNSALDYELAVLKSALNPMLMEVKPQHQEYAESRRLQEFLLNFLEAPTAFVPQTSILREYIGASSFKY